MPSNIDLTLWTQAGPIPKSAAVSPTGTAGVLEMLAQPAKEEIEALQASVDTLSTGGANDAKARAAAAAAEADATAAQTTANAAQSTATAAQTTANAAQTTATAAQTTANAAQTTANAAMPKSGGAFTGVVTLVADPSAALGAATKQYVDAATGRSASYYSTTLSAAANSISVPVPTDGTWKHIRMMVFTSALSVTGVASMRVVTTGGTTVSSGYSQTWLAGYISSDSGTSSVSANSALTAFVLANGSLLSQTYGTFSVVDIAYVLGYLSISVSAFTNAISGTDRKGHLTGSGFVTLSADPASFSIFNAAGGTLGIGTVATVQRIA